MSRLFAAFLSLALLASCSRADTGVKVEPDYVPGLYPFRTIQLQGPGYRSLSRIPSLYTEAEWKEIGGVHLYQNEMEGRYRLSKLGPGLRAFWLDDHQPSRAAYYRGKQTPVIDARGLPALEKVFFHNCVVHTVLFDDTLSTLKDFDHSKAILEVVPRIPAASPLASLDFLGSGVLSFNPASVSPGITRFRSVWVGPNLNGIESLPNLKWMVLKPPHDPPEYDPASITRRLNQERLTDISAIAKLSKLEYVWIDDAPNLSDVSALIASATITNLRLERLPKLVLPSLAGMKSLKGLSLERSGLTSTAFLTGLDHRLEVCLLAGNPLRTVQGLAASCVAPNRLCVPTNERPVEPSFTIDLDQVESIAREDYAFLKAMDYPTLAVLDDRIAKGLAAVK